MMWKIAISLWSLCLIAAACRGPAPASATAAVGSGSLRAPAERLACRSEEPAEPPALPGGPLALEDAISLALRSNPDIQMAASRIRQAESDLDAAGAVFLPWIGMDTGYVRADSPSTFLFKKIDSRTLQPGTDFNDPGEAGFFETGVGARYNLFNGGRDVLRRWMARTGLSIRQLDRRVVKNALVASVIRTFYDVKAADANIGTARASAATVEAELKEARVKFETGRTLRSDVLSLEVRLAEARDQVIRAENAKRLATAALANLLGLDAGSEIEVAADGDPAGDVVLCYPDALAEALLHRPEMLRARRRVESAHFQLCSEKSAFLPTVDAHARVYWDDEHMSYDADNTNWLVGVQLGWDLFQGGARLARARKAEAVLAEMLEADRKAALDVQLDVKTACLRVEEARSRLQVAGASVEQAEETLDLVRKQYEGGTATVTRYLEAEMMLTHARMRETNARYDLAKAAADRERAMGRLASPEDTDR